MDTRIWYTLLVALVVLERGVELVISRRNRTRLLARGGFEVGAHHYPWMVLMHATLPIACVAEVWIAGRSFHPLLGVGMALLVAVTMALRYWVVLTLGERWTTRVVVLPGAPLLCSGPYRFLEHPNYLAVVLEVAALPLVHGAWLTAILFSALNALLLRTRLEVENRALGDIEIFTGIQQVALEHVGYDGPLDPELRLVEDLKLDSLKSLTLAVEIENHFRICLDSENEARILTVGDLVGEVRRLLERDTD